MAEVMYFEKGGVNENLSSADLREGLYTAFEKLGKRRKVMVIPPDITRFHSRAGELTALAYQYFGKALTDIMPALGTHVPMTENELDRMYPGVPYSLFREHRWRTDLVTLGSVPGSFVEEVSEGLADFDWPAQINRLPAEGGFDLILSVGQVVPHEVIGMANHTKNIFIGTGGSEGIHKSHYLGALYGMERIMGRADTPVRAVLDYAASKFASHLPVVYVLTVIEALNDGTLAVRGLYIGEGKECFYKAAELSFKVNFTMVEKPIEKCIVYLDPAEFRSTWLGNKAIYRTRMAMADNGELIIAAPGVKEFGEDREIDALIREYGYRGTENTLNAVKMNTGLRNNLSAAAHLIHGSSEGRFRITYAPGILSRKEIIDAGYNFMELDEVKEHYRISELQDGWNNVNGEDIFFVSNPALGLWAHKSRFSE